MYAFNKIKKLKSQGKNISQISEELNLDWKTVKKYFDSESPPQPLVRKHKTRQDPLEGFYNRINELSQLEDLSFWDIYNELSIHQYKGSYHTVRRYLNKHKINSNKERYFEQEYFPGDELQVDFKEEIEVKMEHRTEFVHLFFGTLPYSSRVFAKAFPALNFECFSNGLACTFEYFQGIPQKVRQDNLKPCVSAILKGKSRIYTEKYNKFIEYYDYEVSPCRPGKGNDKGHVERDIRTFASRIKSRLKIENKEFQNFSDLNQWLIETIEQLQGPVGDKFKEDQLKLKPLRPRRIDLESHKIVTSGSKYGTIRYGKSIYSIPDGFIETNVTVEATAYDINIYNLLSGQSITTHQRLPDHSQSIKLEHVVQSLIRKPAALLHWKHRSIIFNDSVLSKFYLILKKQDSYNAEKKLLQALNLIQFVSLEEIKASIELWFENQSNSPFEFIRELTIEERRPLNHVKQNKIIPDLEHYDQFLKGENNDAFVH